MKSDSHERIAAWWRRTRPWLHPIGDEPPLDPDELERLLADAMPLSLGTRLALPDVFKQYLAVIGSRHYLSQRLGFDFQLWPASTVLANARSDSQVFRENVALIERAGPWIRFGKCGGHDDFFLCADPASAEHGHVMRGDDSHPWLNERNCFTPEGPLLDWLDAMRPSSGTRRWAAIILDRDELARLQAARARDPYEALVAARDLELDLTPDQAWGREGAPERVESGWSGGPWLDGIENIELIARDDAGEVAIAAPHLLAELAEQSFDNIRPFFERARSVTASVLICIDHPRDDP